MRNEADTRADLIDPILKQVATTEESSVVKIKGELAENLACAYFAHTVREAA
jgi:hypothetical protein